MDETISRGEAISDVIGWYKDHVATKGNGKVCNCSEAAPVIACDLGEALYRVSAKHRAATMIRECVVPGCPVHAKKK